MKNIILRKINYLTDKDFTYGKIPWRMMYLSNKRESEDLTSTAFERLRQLQGYMPMIYTDIYRSPASSAEAYARKTGVAEPGLSGHNYGISVDVAIDASLKRHAIDYNTLCNTMIAFGWTPYQGITSTGMYSRGKEDWHFNFVGDFTSTPINDVKPGAQQVTKWINSNYVFESDVTVIQTLLTKLKFYQGAIDGQVGPLTSEAIKKFKRAWMPPKLLSLGVNGKLDDRTIRLINIVSCEVIDEQTGAKIG